MREFMIFFFLFGTAVCHFETSECGKTKQCMFSPPGCEGQNKCVLMYSYKPGEDGWTDMELFSSNDEPSNNYVAVGFSKDDKMGEDHVTQCVFPESGKPEVHVSFNFGKSNTPPTEAADLESEKNSLKMVHAHKGDDGMYCHFSQKTSKPVRQFLPELDADSTILLARGKARQPRELGIHTLDPSAPDFPFISSKPVKVAQKMAAPTTAKPVEAPKPTEAPKETEEPAVTEQAGTEEAGPEEEEEEEVEEEMSPGAENPAKDTPEDTASNEAAETMDHDEEIATPMPSTDAPATAKPSGWFSPQTKFALVKYHGVLMIIGWLFFVVLAVLSARYLRDQFPNSNPLGLKWWFHLHRTLNIIGVFVILVSTLLIFLAKEFNWTGPAEGRTSTENLGPGSIHSLMGTIAIMTSIINPLMSLLRCAPDTGARPIFNWGHRLVGLIGVFCAAVAILIAGNSFVPLWSDSSISLTVIIFFIVILIAAIIGFEVLSYLKSKHHKETDMEMRKRNGLGYENHMRSTSAPPRKLVHGSFALYLLFSLFAFCICAGLCIMLLI